MCLRVFSCPGWFQKLGSSPECETIIDSMMYIYNFEKSFSVIREAIIKKDEILFNRMLDEQSETFKKRPSEFNKETLLHVVARYGSLEAANRLIKLGFDINAKDIDGRTPLYQATKWKTEMVELLLKNGADVKINRNNGKTFLQVALERGSVDTVHLLLRKLYSDYCKSSEILRKQEKQKSSKCKELQDNDVKICKEIVKFLLKQKYVDYLILPQNEDSLPRTRKQLILEYLLKPSRSKYSLLLHFALKYGDEETFKLILSKRKNLEINAVGSKGCTLLYWAIYFKKKHLLKQLINLGAHMYHRDEYRNTMFHYAVRKFDADVIDFLICNGLDINAKNNNNCPPICYLIRKSDAVIPMVEFLVDNGADVNIYFENEDYFTSYIDYDYGYGTPLHRAAHMDSVNLVENLLELKADFTAKTADGRWPLILSIGNENDGCIVRPRFKPRITSSTEVLLAFMATTEVNLHDPEGCNISQHQIGNLIHDIFYKCKVEVKRMKIRNICEDRNVSFFKFLTLDVLEVTLFARCEDAMEILETEEYKKEFPSYAFLLEKRIERVKEMMRLMDVTSALIKDYAEIKLPAVVIGKIFSFLRAGDFRNVGRALSLRK